MSIQFAGSKSQDDRRRRRLVVNADDYGADETGGEENLSAPGVASELVASAAAGPWVPVYEFRLWTYAAIMYLVLSAAAFALAMPTSFRPELGPLTKHFLEGDRPVLAVLIQTLFCFLSAQLAVLIGWYRAQCKLDFAGRYRVWPWAATTFAIAAFCSCTNAHHLLGRIIEASHLLTWRANVVAWLLPACIAALPLVLLIDRDVRRSQSCLWTLRIAWMLGLTSTCLEIFAPDLMSYPWILRARVILPLFVIATVFVGLWLHARTVAYICPDPPDAAEGTALSQLIAGWRWIAARLVIRRKTVPAPVEEKPKRGRRKAAADEEEDSSTPKRKRKAPARKTPTRRTRAKAAEVEEEAEEEESLDTEETSGSEDSYESEQADVEQGDSESAESEWEQEEEAPPAPPARSNSQTNAASRKNASQQPAPQQQSWNESDEESAGSEDDDEDSEGASYRRDDGAGADPLKGLSKRQKRELRRQSKEQQRNQRH